MLFCETLNAQVNYIPRTLKKQSLASDLGGETASSEERLVLIVKDKDGNAAYQLTLDSIRGLLRHKKDSLKKVKITHLINGRNPIEIQNEYREAIIGEYEDAIQRYEQAFGIKSGFFPARNRFLARTYYSNSTDISLEVLKNNSISISSSLNQGSLYSELIAGYIGFFRIGLGAMISQSEFRSITSDDIQNLTTEELDQLRKSIDEQNSANLTAQNILGGGGNLLLNLSTPLIDVRSAANNTSFIMTAFERIGFAVPSIGTISDDTQLVNQFGVQTNFWYDLDFMGERDFAFGLSTLISVVSNDEYEQTLGLTGDQKSFSFMELTPSLDIDGRFRVFVNIPIIFSDITFEESFKTNIGVSILPFK